jgi:hypothetical protein
MAGTRRSLVLISALRITHRVIMGAHYSSTRSSFTADCAADDGPGSADPRLMSSRNASSPIVPPTPMPQLMRPETFEEKLYRKVCVCNAKIISLLSNYFCCVVQGTMLCLSARLTDTQTILYSNPNHNNNTTYYCTIMKTTTIYIISTHTHTHTRT